MPLLRVTGLVNGVNCFQPGAADMIQVDEEGQFG